MFRLASQRLRERFDASKLFSSSIETFLPAPLSTLLLS
jgi:hypothetical protein